MQKPSDGAIRKILTGAATTLAGALVVAVVWYVPTYVSDVHADQHTGDVKQMEAVKETAVANAQYISDQILINLYMRERETRRELAVDPGDRDLISRLAALEIEIRRREEGSLKPLPPDL